MTCSLSGTLRSHRFRSLFFSALLLAVSGGCVPRPALHFSSAGSPSLEKKIRDTGSRNLAVVTFSDDRIVAEGAGDPRLIGWGTGTGTLDTRDNIKKFVTRSFVEEFGRVGLPARLVSVPVTPFRAPEHRLRFVKKFLHGNEVAVLGKIREFQFQIDHPRYGMGPEFSLLDMQDARIRVQVSIDLRFMDAGTGQEIWSGTLSSAQEKEVHYEKRGEGLRTAMGLLADNLRKVILDAAGKWTARGF